MKADIIEQKFLTFTKNFNQWGINPMTNYSRKANPNATNSELDAKVIIKHPQLNNSQRDELIEQFVEIQLDNMDTQSLYELASEYLLNSFDRLTDNEIKERIESLYDAELYEELVENIQVSDLMKEVS